MVPAGISRGAGNQAYLYPAEIAHLRAVLGANPKPLNPSTPPTVALNSSALSGSQTIQAITQFGTAQGGSLTSITLKSGDPATNGIYQGQRINIVSGTGFGQTAIITSFNTSTKVATVAAWTPSPGALVAPPDSTSVYNILNVSKFAFVGANPQFLGFRANASPQYQVLQNCAGNMEGLGSNQFTTTFHTSAQTFDLIQYGASYHLTLWVDDQLVGTYSAALNTGTCPSSGSSNTIVLATGASSTNGFYNQQWITITGGTGVLGETRQVVSYVGSTRTATVASAFTDAPDSTTQYSVNQSSSGIALDGVTGSEKYLNLSFGTASASTVFRKITVLCDGFAGINVGQTDSVTPGEPYGPMNLIVLGDSFTEPTQSPANGPGMTEILARYLGMQSWHLGEGGTGWFALNTASDRLSFMQRICPPAESFRANITATGGSYSLSVTYGGSTQTTSTLAWNASCATVQAALQALSNVPASSIYMASGSVAVGGGDQICRPLTICLYGVPGAMLTVNTGVAGSCAATNAAINTGSGSLTGGTINVAPYQGDMMMNVPTDANGKAVPFVLYVPGSGNDASYTPSAVGAAAQYAAQQIPILYPTAIPIFGCIVSVSTHGVSGLLDSTDMAWRSALLGAAQLLPTLPNGMTPFVDTYANGLGGYSLLFRGVGSVAGPTNGTNDILVSVVDSQHPTDNGHYFIGAWHGSQIRALIGVNH
jgi:hypothetical protein